MGINAPLALAGRIVLVVLIVSCLSHRAPAQQPASKLPPVKNFSSNHDDTLTRDDLWVFLLYKENPTLDASKPLSLEMRRAALVFAKTQQRLVLLVHDADALGPGPYKSADIQRVYGPKQPQLALPTKGTFEVAVNPPNPMAPRPNNWAILIRQSYEQLDFYNNKAKPQTLAKPAIFSYAWNELKGQDVWTAQGAVMLPFGFPQDQNISTTHPYLADIFVVPSVTFDRLTGSGVDKTKQTDSLTFRLGSDFEFNNVALPPLPPLDKSASTTSHDFRLNFTHATDFEFRSQLVGGELDWEPTWLDGAIGVYKPLFWTDDPIWFRLRFYLHSEAGSVLDPGTKKDLASIPGDFVRMGFFGQVEVRPKAFQRLVFTVNYQDYESLISGSPSSHLFTAAVQLNLDASGNFSLNARYRNGRLPFTLDPVEDVTVGLGLLF